VCCLLCAVAAAAASAAVAAAEDPCASNVPGKCEHNSRTTLAAAVNFLPLNSASSSAAAAAAAAAANLLTQRMMRLTTKTLWLTTLLVALCSSLLHVAHTYSKFLARCLGSIQSRQADKTTALATPSAAMCLASFCMP
jgi:tetrahydromethanopterin S-methyltransferase subunit E